MKSMFNFIPLKEGEKAHFVSIRVLRVFRMGSHQCKEL